MARDGSGWKGLVQRRSIERAVAQSERSGYVRALGPLTLTNIGIAALVGAGIFFLLGLEARTTGPAVILSLVLAGVAAVLAALAYAEFASLVPGSGSAYAYTFAAFGRLPAFLMGWIILNAYAVGNVAVAIGWAEFFSAGLAQVGFALPDALTRTPGEGGWVNLPAVAVVVVVTVLLLPRIKESAAVNNFLVFLKVGIVLFVIGFGALFVRPANWEPFSPTGTAGVVESAAILFFAYLGFDTIAATAEEARRPRRDLPLAIVASVGVAMLLYVAMAAVVTGMTAAPDLAGRAPIAAAFANEGHAWAAGLVTVGALIALGTVLYAFHLALARILQAMARDGFLPAPLARLNARTHTPWTVTLVTGALMALGAGLLRLESVVDMAVEASIFIYVLVAAGVLAMRRLRPDARPRFRTHPVVSVLAILVLLGIVAFGLSLLIHLAFLAWLALGLILYGFYAHARSERADATAMA